jgi:hypothetical protein
MASFCFVGCQSNKPEAPKINTATKLVIDFDGVSTEPIISHSPAKSVNTEFLGKKVNIEMSSQSSSPRQQTVNFDLALDGETIGTIPAVITEGGFIIFNDNNPFVVDVARNGKFILSLHATIPKAYKRPETHLQLKLAVDIRSAQRNPVIVRGKIESRR